MTTNITKYSDAISETISIAMAEDDKVLCFGLGVTDPKEVFGTTQGLLQKFGPKRVFDTPCSENAMTGIGIGASMRSFKPIMTHQRLDFFLLAMDQLVNSAAKWHFMFGSQVSIPITIRLILGRGWGQGPTHAQNLQAWFAHIPGLKVVCPSNSADAKGLLMASIFDPNPVVFLEHRWLHNSTSEVPSGYYELPLGKANVVVNGTDLTIVTSSYMVSECLDAATYLQKEHNISCEVIDLRTIKPLDYETIFKSLEKTENILCVETSAGSFSVSSEIISRVMEEEHAQKKYKAGKISLPDMPEPTGYSLTKNYYNNADDVINKVLSMTNNYEITKPIIRHSLHHDIPGDWFKGPF